MKKKNKMEILLKASAVTALFYLCYKLFLQRETFFESNRWFLLSGLVLSVCVPFLVIPIYIESIPVSNFVIANGENRNGQGKDFSAMKVRKSNAMTPPPTLTASELNLKNALNGQEAPGFSQLGEMSNAMNLTRSGLSSFQNSLFP